MGWKLEDEISFQQKSFFQGTCLFSSGWLFLFSCFFSLPCSRKIAGLWAYLTYAFSPCITACLVCHLWHSNGYHWSILVIELPFRGPSAKSLGSKVCKCAVEGWFMVHAFLSMLFLFLVLVHKMCTPLKTNMDIYAKRWFGKGGSFLNIGHFWHLFVQFQGGYHQRFSTLDQRWPTSISSGSHCRVG